MQDVFYQVFDKGTMKDGEGRDIDFKNTVLIMTSNLGSELIAKLFADPETRLLRRNGRSADAGATKYFKPAFLGRVTLVPFTAPLRRGHPADRRVAALAHPAARQAIRTARNSTTSSNSSTRSRSVHRDLIGRAQYRKNPIEHAPSGAFGRSSGAARRRAAGKRCSRRGGFDGNIFYTLH